MKFEWFVASRYLLSRRKQSFISIISVISILGVGLGVAIVIIVIAVLDGVEHGLRDRFLANEAHVVLRLIDHSFFSGYQEKIDNISQVEGVVAASPVVYSQMGVFQLGQKSLTDAIYIKGIDLEQEDKVTGFSQYVSGSVEFQTSPLIEVAERREAETISGGIVLGYRLANQLGLSEGDVLRLVVKLEDNPMSVGSPTLFVDFANFVVIGVYESELAIYDSRIGYIDISTAQKLYENFGKVNVILVRLEDSEMAPALSPIIEEAAGFSEVIEIPMTTTWLETHSALFAALKMERIATIIIEALIILVAAFNIISTLIMTVMEKTRDIGTLRTIGASRGNIMRIFMLQGSVIGMIGTIAGSALGLYICWLLSTNIIRPSHWYVLLVCVILSICQIVITYRNIDIVGMTRSIFVLIGSIILILSANILVIASLLMFRDSVDLLVSFADRLLSSVANVLPFVLPFWLLTILTVVISIVSLSLFIFWIFMMIRSWFKLSAKWKIAFFSSWMIAIVFGLFCLVEPISLLELGFSEIYQMNQLPIKVNWYFVCLINLFSFEICWLATIYPAWQASKLKPIEALQYE